MNKTSCNCSTKFGCHFSNAILIALINWVFVSDCITKKPQNQSKTIPGKGSNLWKASHGGGVGLGLPLVWSKLYFPVGGRACILSSSTLPSDCGGFLPPAHFLAFCWLQQSFPSLKSQQQARNRYPEGTNLQCKMFCW